MNHQFKGVSYGAIAAISYGMNPLFTLPLYAGGMKVDSVLFYRYVFAILALAALMKIKKESFKITLQETFILLIIGLLFSSSSLCLFQSYRYMDAGIASTILFIYPVMVAVLMGLFFKERLSWSTIGSLMLTLIGIGLLYKGKNGQPLSTVGIVLVLLSSLAYAIYIIGVNRSSLRQMSGLKLTFYALLFGSSIYLVRLHLGTDLQPIPSADLWACAIALAIFPTVISLLFTTLSAHHIGSTPTAILGALEPVTALFFGVLLFNEQLTLRILLGIFTILSGVSLIVLKKEKPKKTGVMLEINKK